MAEGLLQEQLHFPIALDSAIISQMNRDWGLGLARVAGDALSSAKAGQGTDRTTFASVPIISADNERGAILASLCSLIDPLEPTIAAGFPIGGEVVDDAATGVVQIVGL